MSQDRTRQDCLVTFDNLSFARHERITHSANNANANLRRVGDGEDEDVVVVSLSNEVSAVLASAIVVLVAVVVASVERRDTNDS